MDVVRCMEKYRSYLCTRGLSERTIESYIWVASFFERNYPQVDANSLRAYRMWLVDSFKPGTVNQRIQAINCYLGYLGKGDLKLKAVRVQQRTYLESTISDADYERFLAHLRSGGGHYLRDYCAVRIMATTGVRVSELLRMRAEHVRAGSFDLDSKGKVRRVYLPRSTAGEVSAWLDGEGIGRGAFLLNRYGRPISARGLSLQLKVRGAECGIDEACVHPHAFRHLFARRFLQAGGDLALLADLLGHSSVDTTRIYLRRTAQEQHDELNRLVSW